MSKKNKRIAFIFDERSLTNLENMTQEGHFSSFSNELTDNCTEIVIKHPETGEKRIIKIPKLPPLPRSRL